MDLQRSINKMGYKKNSPFKNKDSLRIEGNKISMSDVEFPIMGVDSFGRSQLMFPGNDYNFENAEFVDEFPVMGKGGSGIHIKESKKGTFTKAAKAHGKGVQEFANQVLANPDNYSPAMRKKAQFAHNAASFKRQMGGQPVNSLTPQQWELYNQNLGLTPSNQQGMSPYKQYKQPGAGSRPYKDPITGQMNHAPYITYSPPPDTLAGKVSDPTKQPGFNGMLPPEVQQYKAGGMSKYLVNYCKSGGPSVAPQGESMDEYLTKHNNEFVDYLAANTRKAILKDEVMGYQDPNYKKQTGGMASETNIMGSMDEPDPSEGFLDLIAPAPQQRNSSWAPAWQTPTPPVNPQASQNSKLFPLTPRGNSGIQEADPNFGDDYLKTDQNPVQQNAQIQKSNFPDLADIALTGLRITNSFLRNRESRRQQNLLYNKMTVDKFVPTTYGNKGDYNINSGEYRQDRKTPAFYQYGGANGYHMMSDGTMMNNEEMQGPFVGMYNNATISDEIIGPMVRGYPHEDYWSPNKTQPMFNKGGSKKCYKKGGTYDGVTEEEMRDLIRQGYQIEFVD